jgi:integrase
LFEGWAAEKRPTEKTIYSWKRVLDQLVEFVGHTDAVRLTPDDLLRWKASLLDAGLRTKTIRDSKLAPVRAILQWGVDNRKLAANPAARIVIDVRSKMTERIRGFTDEEAALILRNAAKEKDPVRRWVPLLCAYSGARLSEVCQLRVEDVFQRGGVWCMKFDPEAGSLKNENSERAVPLHPAIVESGFPQFVAAARSGPLFTGLQADRFGNRGGNGTKTIGRWVRGLGLTDERLSPSHSWRHRFKTLGRQFGLAPDIVNAITGHLRKTVADSYGEFPMDALFREIAKIPAFDVT